MKLLSKENFQRIIDGKVVSLFTLRNKHGYVAQFTNYGARWLSMWIPDKNNEWSDVLLGFDSLEEYLHAKEKYHGAIVGRVCGRIDQGAFTLKGEKYYLANNDLFGNPVKNHLHGGVNGFSFRVWDANQRKNKRGEDELVLTYLSKSGEEGYPGNLTVKVIYTLSNENGIRMDYSAFTDEPTVINLTNHAYFNLHGDMSRNVLDHLLCIHAESSIESNENLIPTGKIIFIKDTPLDFSHSEKIGLRINEEFPGQLFSGKGYVVAYVLNESDESLRLVASVEEKGSGRFMEIYTDQPNIQFYNAWLMDGSDIGKNNQQYNSSVGLALEAQGYPDAVNHRNFPSIELNPGEEYEQTTIYRFRIE
jgi:aldose 1-epimerase